MATKGIAVAIRAGAADRALPLGASNDPPPPASAASVRCIHVLSLSPSLSCVSPPLCRVSPPGECVRALACLAAEAVARNTGCSPVRWSVRRSVVAQTQLSSDRPVQVGDGAVAATTTDGGDDDDDLLTLRCAWESLAAVGGSGELWQEGSRVGAVAVERPSDGRTEAVGLCVCVRR